MKIDPNDPLFVKRGIDPEVALAQGFEMWTPEDHAEVIDTAYEAIIETQRGSVQWLRGKALESGTGLIITRHSPVKVFDKEGNVRPLVPEIRPDRPVKSGMTKRHYHGLEKVPFEFLPSVVETAHCRPSTGFIKSYRLKFKHDHSSLEIDELREHTRIWHQPDLGEHGELETEAIDVVNNPVRGSHWHTLEVYPQKVMTDHVNQGADGEVGKKTWPHKGEHNHEIHCHTPMAKYLFAPSAKHEETWDHQSHDHGRMTPEELEWHVKTYHTTGESQ